MIDENAVGEDPHAEVGHKAGQAVTIAMTIGRLASRMRATRAALGLPTVPRTQAKAAGAVAGAVRATLQRRPPGARA